MLKASQLPAPSSLLLSLQDVQVPVCPLCNTPVPVRREEMPDIVVGEHIDRDCKSDPAQRKRKVCTVWLCQVNSVRFLMEPGNGMKTIEIQPCLTLSLAQTGSREGW